MSKYHCQFLYLFYIYSTMISVYCRSGYSQHVHPACLLWGHMRWGSWIGTPHVESCCAPCRLSLPHLHDSLVSSWWSAGDVSGSYRMLHECVYPPAISHRQANYICVSLKQANYICVSMKQATYICVSLKQLQKLWIFQNPQHILFVPKNCKTKTALDYYKINNECQSVEKVCFCVLFPNKHNFLKKQNLKCIWKTTYKDMKNLTTSMLNKITNTQTWYHSKKRWTSDIVICFLLGNSSASEFYIPKFRNTLFHLHRQVGMKNNWGWECWRKGLARKF
jgi:hypothetical protein